MGLIELTRRAGLGALVVLAALTAAPDPGVAADKIAVGALRFTSHSGSFIAYERGYFADEGLEVEFKFFQAAQPMAVAIASGDVDFGVTAITGGLINLADKGAVKVIGGVLHEQPGIEGSAILVSNAAYEAGLTSPDKLPGHSFGITQTGSSFHYMAARIAEKEGFGIDELKLKPLQKVGAVIAALKSGQIDAWAIAPHIAKALDKAGAAKIIGWVNDYAPDCQVTTVFTSTENATNRRDLTERFLRALSRGIADFDRVMLDQAADPAATEATVKLIHKYVYADRPYEKAAPSIKNGAMWLNEGAKLNLTNVKAQLAWFQSEGLVSNAITRDHHRPAGRRQLRRDLLIGPRGGAGGRWGARTAGGWPMDLRLEGIAHRYHQVEVLNGIDLTIGHGQIVCIVGPSGCGKSTLLRLIGGLERPAEGTVLQLGEPPADSFNPLTYIFQDFALLPWRTVAGNVSLVLEDHRLGSAQMAAIVEDVLARTKLSEFRDALPRQLSGGMKQRVGIARALAVRPAVLLMDEPLSALDGQTRELLMDDLADLWIRERFTAVYVTHNLDEAVRLGHKIVVLSRRPGRIRETVEIDLPLGERAANPGMLEAKHKHLWSLIRAEAEAADMELADA